MRVPPPARTPCSPRRARSRRVARPLAPNGTGCPIRADGRSLARSVEAARAASARCCGATGAGRGHDRSPLRRTGRPDVQAGHHQRTPHPRDRHRLAGGADRSALGTHQPSHRAPAAAPQGPPQPAWSAHARRSPAPDARLRPLDRRQPLPRDRRPSSAYVDSTTDGFASPPPNASYTASSRPPPSTIAHGPAPSGRGQHPAVGDQRRGVVVDHHDRQRPHGLDRVEQLHCIGRAGFIDRERPDRGAAEVAQVGAASEEATEVGRQRPHVGPRRALDVDGQHAGIVGRRDLERVHRDGPRPRARPRRPGEPGRGAAGHRP